MNAEALGRIQTINRKMSIARDAKTIDKLVADEMARGATRHEKLLRRLSGSKRIVFGRDWTWCLALSLLRELPMALAISAFVFLPLLVTVTRKSPGPALLLALAIFVSSMIAWMVVPTLYGAVTDRFVPFARLYDIAGRRVVIRATQEGLTPQRIQYAFDHSKYKRQFGISFAENSLKYGGTAAIGYAFEDAKDNPYFFLLMVGGTVGSLLLLRFLITPHLRHSHLDHAIRFHVKHLEKQSNTAGPSVRDAA